MFLSQRGDEKPSIFAFPGHSRYETFSRVSRSLSLPFAHPGAASAVDILTSSFTRKVSHNCCSHPLERISRRSTVYTPRWRISSVHAPTFVPLIGLFTRLRGTASKLLRAEVRVEISRSVGPSRAEPYIRWRTWVGGVDTPVWDVV